MEEKTEIREDPTLFRRAQLIESEVSDKKVLETVVESARQYTLGGTEIPKRFYEFIEQYQESKRQPYAVEFYKAEAIYGEKTKEDFKTIDDYILQALRKANQQTTPEAYEDVLLKIEDALGLTKNSETLHRITEVVKFINYGKYKYSKKNG